MKALSMKSLEALNNRIIQCVKCPRLIKHCTKIAKEKKREFREDTYWGKPVPGFGDPKAQIWIIGLAPAAHGANRTGRMFTGDSSGKWLYRALYKAGFANQENSHSKDDGLKLDNVYISAAARCAPLDNKPTLQELKNCFVYLKEEYKHLNQVWLYLALGKIAFDTTLKFLESQGEKISKPRPKFAHGAYYDFGNTAVLCSYHPSRQNTQTGKLTEEMWQEIFYRAKNILKTRTC